MSFTTIALSNHRVLVRGTDKFGAEGQEVLCAGQWDAIIEHDKQLTLTDAFDDAVREFFAPLDEAIEQAAKAGEHVEDPNASIVLHEGAEGVEKEDEVRVELNRDSQILRLLENNEWDRLIWVAPDQLEILAYQAEVEDAAGV